MTCLDYLKNFYNDHNFRVHKYAHLLHKVGSICNLLVQKFSEQQNYRALNDVLELYRYIVEKYAVFKWENGETIMADLAKFLH